MPTRREYFKNYQIQNKEYIRQYQKEWREANKELLNRRRMERYYEKKLQQSITTVS